jgi:hypothetical protein
LSFEPVLAYEQTIDDTRAVILVGTGDLARRLCSLDDGWSDDIAMWCCDALFRQFTRDDLFELILETERNEGDLSRRDCRGNQSIMMGGEEARELISEAAVSVILTIGIEDTV